MNEQQFLLATRNVIRLEDMAAATAKKIAAPLKNVLEDIAELISNLPEDDIFRQIRYKQLYQQLASIYFRPNEQFKVELLNMLHREIEGQVKFARDFLQAGNTATGIQTVGAAQPPVAITETARGFTGGIGTPPPTLGPGNYGVGTEITRTQLMALADDTQVLGQRLDKLFELDDRGTSTWIRSNIDQIDRTVKTGFLTGQSNSEIARALQDKLRANKAQSEAVARTAVMDMSQRAQAKFYDANRSRIYAYEYDATFDYRVCEECAPWSGAIRRKRSELPDTPRHPNCRCLRLPITRTEWELRKSEAPERSSFVDLVPGERVMRGPDGKPLIGPSGKYRYEKLPRPREREGEQFYKRPVMVDGQRFWRKRIDAPAAANRQDQMAQFLGNSSKETQEMVMGTERSEKFRRLLREKDRNGDYRFTPQQALIKVLPRR